MPEHCVFEKCVRTVRSVPTVASGRYGEHSVFHRRVSFCAIHSYIAHHKNTGRAVQIHALPDSMILVNGKHIVPEPV